MLNEFRVWTGLKMEYDVVVGRFGAFYVNPMKKGDGLDETDTASLTPFNTMYDPEQHPLMQQVGVIDREGNEWWESDIILCSHEGDNSCGVIVKGKYGWRKRYYSEDDKEYFTVPLSDLDFEHFIKIGDIHENPELLEAK